MRSRPAFRVDHRAQKAMSALKVVWWGAAGAAVRAVVRAEPPPRPAPSDAPLPPPPGFLRRAWREAFDKEGQDIAGGLFPPMEALDHPARTARRAADLVADARLVERRRRHGGAVEAREDAPPSQGYPPYYRQNFHYQTGGWFTVESAQRYEAQVETLFAGAAGAMRRRALALLARAWRRRDHRGLRIVDLACGSGAFLQDLSRAFPRARLIGLDLSTAYLAEASQRSAVSLLVQANAERLPIASASLDAVTCVYLFHELPPKVRLTVAAEIARVLRPGAVLAFADAVQSGDEPRLARLLMAFPANFHEPYFASYDETDLVSLFAGVGLQRRDGDRAFLTKALLFEKTDGRSNGQPT